MRSHFKSTSLTLSMALVGGFSCFTDLPKAQAAALEEVVVTARKREESLQKTPLSVMAFGGDALEKQNVADLKALSVKLPNVSIGGSGGLGGSNAAFYVRGIGTARNAINQESAVALYVDDAYIGRSDGALLSVVDVEKIEALRGPQGTLFGRSATAGAIRYITAKPNFDGVSGKLQANLGSENRADFKGVVNLPLSDTVAVRLMGATLNQDGHVDGAFNGVDYGDVNSDLVRGYVRWAASDTVEVLASVDHTRMDTNGGAAILLAVNPNPPASGPTGVVLQNEAAAGFDATTLPTGDYDTSWQTGLNFYDSDNTGANLTVNWDISEDVALKSSTTYRDIDIDGAIDADATHASLWQQNFVRTIAAFSQEFQVSGSTDRLEWLAGVFYYTEKSTEQRLVASGENSNPGASNTRVTDPYEVDSLAVFGQGTYELNDDWSVTVGLRYTEDEKRIVADELNAAGTSKLANLGGPVERNKSWDAISGRMSLEWNAAEDVFLFASFARGFRAGGFNDRIRTNLPNNFFGITDFDEETLDMIEVGFRSELLDHRLRVNGTLFYGEFTDRQIPLPVLDAVTGLPTNRTAVKNAGESEVKGLEVEVTWAVTDIITLDATLGLLDAGYTKLDPSVTSVTLDSEFARAPEASFSLGISADWEDISARFDYGWKDSHRLSEADNTAIVQDAYGLLSANVTYAPLDVAWSVSVYGTNLTDEEYLEGGLDFRTNPVATMNGVPGRFAEYGVKLNYKF